MKASELRLGNCVQDLEGRIAKITGLSDPVISTEYMSGDIDAFIDPVPLTEEWMLKFGFKKEEINPPTDQHGCYFSMNHYDCKYSFCYASFREDWGFYFSYTDAVDDKDNNKFDFVSCGIKYVHQLQNLYFALTEQELTIK